MKVCHITVAHEYNDIRIFHKECRSLFKNGYDVSIVAPNTLDTVMDGIKIYGVKVNGNPLIRLFFGAGKIYKRALQLDADIYHFHDIEMYTYGVKLKKKGKKVIFDSHEDWLGYTMDIEWLPYFIKKIMVHSIRNLYKKYMKCFDAVITVSPHIIDILKQFTSKLYMITNYPIIDKNNIVRFTYDEYCKRNQQICYAGTVYKFGSQNIIIKSIQDISNINYTIIGAIDDEYKKTLVELDKNNKVNFVGRVPRKDVDNFYFNSLFGIVLFDYLPICGGKTGTMGNNKIFEYMQMGLPIVCTDSDCWKKMIVDKYNCGICVSPHNIDDVKGAIEYLLNNKEQAYKMGQNGLNAVYKEFNWNTQEEILLQIYSQM